MIAARVTSILLLASLVALAACGDTRERELKHAAGVVRGIIEDAGRNPIAALSLESALQSGGTVINYVVANLPLDGGALRKFKLAAERPAQGWSIVVRRGDGPRDYVVEAYGEHIDRPLHAESFTIAALKPPR